MPPKSREGPRPPSTAAAKPAPARGALDLRSPYVVPLLLLAVSRLTAGWLLPASAEDAYITFRYARNLAGGHGLVYNPGAHVMGFSSPLWTLWLALGIRLVHDPVIWARVSAWLADGVTLVLLVRGLERHVSRAAAWCFALFFATWFYFSAVAASGMENGVVVMLVVLAATLVERRHVLAGPALAALALSRPEGLAAAAVLAIGATWRDRGIAAVLVVPALLLLWRDFGSIVPQSVLAKAHVYGTPGPWAGRAWWEWLVPFPLGVPPGTQEGVHLFLVAVVLAPAFALGLRALWPHRERGFARAAGVMLLVMAGYSALGVSYFYWYLAVPLAGVALVAAAGLPSLTRGPALYVALACFLAGMWWGTAPLYIGRSQAETQDFGGVADWLQVHAHPGQKVMLEPIGIIGWTCPLVVVDEVGLVSPEVTRRRMQGAGWYADVAAAERPDWLVVRRRELESDAGFAGAGAPFRSVAERDSLLARYTRATVIASTPGPTELWVLARVR